MNPGGGGFGDPFERPVAMVVDDVRNGLDLDAAAEVGTANGEKLNGIIGSISSPHVIVDGEDVTPKENGTLGDWVKAALEAGKA